ncbi:hypothetical protein [Herbaspirillum chlorophenolicum]|uniref:hypothetical protein n=1 Tax=Herbaspirillum chlorophenolicum TaxID=211589 RepID=UPI0012E15CF0|nr:hypothetical protein [Herbaspirillum chlorophenolicum]
MKQTLKTKSARVLSPPAFPARRKKLRAGTLMVRTRPRFAPACDGSAPMRDMGIILKAGTVIANENGRDIVPREHKRETLIAAQMGQPLLRRHPHAWAALGTSYRRRKIKALIFKES